MSLRRSAMLVLAFLFAACAPPPAVPSPAPTATATAQPTPAVTAAPATANPAVTVPTIPAAVAVEIPVKGAALLVLDITTAICTPRPPCVTSLPKIAALIKKARDAKVPVIYSETTTAGASILPEVAPQAGEPSVKSSADKFFNTNLDQLLKDRAVENAVVVGSASNGAVLYTAFGLNLRGYTAVVAVDGISANVDWPTNFVEWQLLNQPGFTNAENKPLDKQHVTLSTTDKITFK